MSLKNRNNYKNLSICYDNNFEKKMVHNRTEWRLIRSVIISVITKSDDRMCRYANIFQILNN